MARLTKAGALTHLARLEINNEWTRMCYAHIWAPLMRCNDPSTHLFSTSCSTLTIGMWKTAEVSGGNLRLELNSPPLSCEATEEPSATVTDDTGSSDISTPARWRPGQLYVHTRLTPSTKSPSSEQQIHSWPEGGAIVQQSDASLWHLSCVIPW